MDVGNLVATRAPWYDRNVDITGVGDEVTTLDPGSFTLIDYTQPANRDMRISELTLKADRGEAGGASSVAEMRVILYDTGGVEISNTLFRDFETEVGSHTIFNCLQGMILCPGNRVEVTGMAGLGGEFISFTAQLLGNSYDA